MNSPVVHNVSLFLADTLLTIYTLLLLLRCILTAVEADFYSPVSQLIVKLTQPPLTLARKLIPSVGRWDFACLLLAYLARVIELFAVTAIQGFAPPLSVLLLIGLIQLAELLIQIYIVAIFLLAISSWFVSGIQAFNHPVISLLHTVTAPLLEPLRRVIPAAGMMDFSPIVALLGLYLLLTVLGSLY